MEDIPIPAIAETARARGWRDYIKTPGPYDPTLVREFYASMIPAIFNQYYTVVVRGVPVRFSMDDICNHFHVARPNNLGMHYGVSPIPGVTRSETHSPIIASSLRRNGSPRWLTVVAELAKSEMPHDLAIWMLFIKHSMKPSTHHSYADPQVARVLYCIQHNLPLDIGHIIQLEMLDQGSPREQGILPFPSLITKFCLDAQVPRIDRLPAAPPLDKRTYRAVINAARKKDDQEALAGERMGITDYVDEDDADDVDCGPEEPSHPPHEEDRSDWPPWALSLDSRMGRIEHSVEELRQLLTNRQPPESGAGGTFSQPPGRRVRGRQAGPSSSRSRRNN